MRNLCDELPIYTWENIAEFINELDIKNDTEQEFIHNLEQLKNCLSINKLCYIDGKRQASNLKEIGAATLLQEIYNCKPTQIQQEKNITNPKILFYEKIKALKNIGVKHIQFGFTGNISKLYDIKVTHLHTLYYNTDVETIKYYTNGSFKVEPDRLYNSYCMTDLTKADYYLEAFIYLHHWKMYIANLCAHVKNFNGEYPNTEEIMSMKLPDLKENGKITSFHITKEKVKQYFKTY